MCGVGAYITFECIHACASYECTCCICMCVGVLALQIWIHLQNWLLDSYNH